MNPRFEKWVSVFLSGAVGLDQRDLMLVVRVGDLAVVAGEGCRCGWRERSKRALRSMRWSGRLYGSQVPPRDVGLSKHRTATSRSRRGCSLRPSALNGESKMNENTYDAIVIGGGHNGLVAAAYLAKHGANTVVLEKRHKTGGAADTMEPWPDELPGVKVNTLSYTMSLMPPTVRRDLQLERFGFKLLPLGQGYMPIRGGGSIIQHTDDAITRESIEKISKKDADAYFAFYEWVGHIADIMGPMLMQTPPHLGSTEVRRPEGRVPAGVGPPQTGRRADRRRHHAAVHDERDRSAGPLVRDPRDEGVHVGQRDHRHVGRPRRAGHRLRLDAPLGRRHRRRRGRELGLHGRRHGRGRRGVRGEREVVRRRGSR